MERSRKNMDFSTQIRRLRSDKKLTQQQMAEKLGISRQAVSSWENDRNLPDIEMLIIISKTFDISLDELILGGNDMNNMTEKLINDGKASRRARMNFICTCTGAGLLLMGLLLLVIRALVPETVDSDGMLQEAFFLVPAGFLFIAAGIMVFVSAGISNLISLCSAEPGAETGMMGKYLGICISVVLFCAGGAMLLLVSNSGSGAAVPDLAVMAGAVVLFAAVMIRSR